MRVGYRTGALDVMLLKAAEVYEADVEAKLRRLSATIEPIIMVLICIIIGFIVLSLYLPVLNLVNVCTRDIKSESGGARRLLRSSVFHIILGACKKCQQKFEIQTTVQYAWPSFYESYLYPACHRFSFRMREQREAAIPGMGRRYPRLSNRLVMAL